MPIHSISIHISICIFINNLALKKIEDNLIKKKKKTYPNLASDMKLDSAPGVP